MKRLIRKSEEEQQYVEQQDPYLGQYVEIVNKNSKYYGFYAWVDKKPASDNRYKIFIEPKEYENTDQYHINFVRKWDAAKWFNIITVEEQQPAEEVEEQK